MNIAILHGRAFDESDRDRSVAVLSVKAAQLLWPGEANPVGRQFMGEDDKVKTLVGIVADVRASLHDNPPPHAYYPYWQRVPGDVVHGGADLLRSDTMAAPIRAALRSEDPQPATRADPHHAGPGRWRRSSSGDFSRPWSWSLPRPRCWWPASAFTAWSRIR